MKSIFPSLVGLLTATVVLMSTVNLAKAASPARSTHRTPGGSFIFRSAAGVVDAPAPVFTWVDAPTKTLARFEARCLTLPPGSIGDAPVPAEADEFSLVIDGEVEMSVEGQRSRLGPGSMWWTAAGDARAVNSVGGRPATCLAMRFHPATRPMRAPEAVTKSPLLSSTRWNWPDIPVKPTKTGERRDIVDAPTRTLLNFECHLTTLLPGNAPHAGHHHPDEEILVVKEGVMEATVGGETHRLERGDWLFVVSGEEHGWRNAGPTSATYYVVRFVTTATPAR